MASRKLTNTSDQGTLLASVNILDYPAGSKEMQVTLWLIPVSKTTAVPRLRRLFLLALPESQPDTQSHGYYSPQAHVARVVYKLHEPMCELAHAFGSEDSYHPLHDIHDRK